VSKKSRRKNRYLRQENSQKKFSLTNFLQNTIFYLFLGLFFLLPFLVSPSSFELFEFPKTLFLYSMTILISMAWLIRMVIVGKIYIRHSWLTWPLLLIFLTQLISSIFSIDPHTSWFGYYSRFNGENN
jgi:hypothetical protein